MDETKQPDLRIVQIFLSAAHFEHGPDALMRSASTKVKVSFTLTVTTAGANEGKAGIITVAIKTQDTAESLYRFHVEITGIVEGETDTPNLSMEDYLTKQGAGMMYPFLREAVANLTGRGRFGPIWLKPFNFLTLELQDTPKGATATD